MTSLDLVGLVNIRKVIDFTGFVEHLERTWMVNWWRRRLFNWLINMLYLNGYLSAH